jgi:hypothetical protein
MGLGSWPRQRKAEASPHAGFREKPGCPHFLLAFDQAASVGYPVHSRRILMSSQLILCPSCGHKSRIRPEIFGQKVKCLYCLESFLATPGVVPRTKKIDSYRLLFWIVSVTMVVTVSTCVYLWRENNELAQRLYDAETRHHDLELEIQNSKDMPIKHYYLVTFDCNDPTGHHANVMEEVYAESLSAAESMLRAKYKDIRISKIIEMRQ